MQLVKNEWIKLWNQKGTWIMAILVIAGVIFVSSLNKYFADDSSTKEARKAANEERIEQLEQWAKDDAEMGFESNYQYDIDDAKYRIEHDLPSPNAVMAKENFNDTATFVTALVGIFSMVVAASIVSNEFGTGTIKMLLTRPAARWKILLSKLVATMLYGVAIFVIGLAVAAIVSYILFPNGDIIAIDMVDGKLTHSAVETNLTESLLYSSASIFMSILFAFMLSTLFGSSTLAVSLTLGIMFLGSTISFFLAKYKFAEYIWFVNDLGQFQEGSIKYIEDLTFGHAVTVNIVYAVIFLGVSFLYFSRRDVTA